MANNANEADVSSLMEFSGIAMSREEAAQLLSVRELQASSAMLAY